MGLVRPEKTGGEFEEKKQRAELQQLNRMRYMLYIMKLYRTYIMLVNLEMNHESA